MWRRVSLLQVDVASLDSLHAPATPELARAGFALIDLARLTRTEEWQDAAVGEETYHLAGR